MRLLGVRHLAVGLPLAMLVAVPLFASERYAALGCRVLDAALFAMAFNLLCQQTRLLSFGQGVYLALACSRSCT